MSEPKATGYACRTGSVVPECDGETRVGPRRFLQEREI